MAFDRQQAREYPFLDEEERDIFIAAENGILETDSLSETMKRRSHKTAKAIPISA